MFIVHCKIFICSASLSIITPFYSACLVETVQSNIASEKTAFYDVFKEGFIRLLQWNCPQKGEFGLICFSLTVKQLKKKKNHKVHSFVMVIVFRVG